MNRLEELLAKYPEPWVIEKEPHDYKDGTTHFTHVRYRKKPDFARGQEITVSIGEHVTPDLAELLILLRDNAVQSCALRKDAEAFIESMTTMVDALERDGNEDLASKLRVWALKPWQAALAGD